MESQFGIAHVWAQGDFVTRSVAILLLIMSVASWVVIIVKALGLMKFKKYVKEAKDFWHSEDFGAALNKLDADPANPFRYLALEGREAISHHRKTSAHLHDTLDVSDWVTRCLRNGINEFTARMQSGLAILASVGSTAPFVGLFGTVWGIMNSFIGIAKSQTTNLAVVAPGIAEALLATALGLVAAIPAVIIYNVFARSIASYKAQVADASAQVLLLVSRDLDMPTSTERNAAPQMVRAV